MAEDKSLKLLNEEKHCFTPQGTASIAENIANVLDDLTDIRANGKVTTEEKKVSVITKDKDSGKLILEDIELSDGGATIEAEHYELIIGGEGNTAYGGSKDAEESAVGSFYARHMDVYDGNERKKVTHYLYSNSHGGRYTFGKMPDVITDGTLKGKNKLPSGDFVSVEDGAFIKGCGKAKATFEGNSELRLSSGALVTFQDQSELRLSNAGKLFINNSQTAIDGADGTVAINILGGLINIDGNTNTSHTSGYITWEKGSDAQFNISTGSEPHIDIHDNPVINLDGSALLELHDYGAIVCEGKGLLSIKDGSKTFIESGSYFNMHYNGSFYQSQGPTFLMQGGCGIVMNNQRYGSPASLFLADDNAFILLNQGIYPHNASDDDPGSINIPYDTFCDIETFRNQGGRNVRFRLANNTFINIESAISTSGTEGNYIHIQCSPNGYNSIHILDHSLIETRQNSIFALRGHIQGKVPWEDVFVVKNEFLTSPEQIGEAAGGSTFTMQGRPIFNMQSAYDKTLVDAFKVDSLEILQTYEGLPSKPVGEIGKYNCAKVGEDIYYYKKVYQRDENGIIKRNNGTALTEYKWVKWEDQLSRVEGSPLFELIDNTEVRFSENVSFKANNNGITYNFGSSDIHFSPQILKALASLTVEQIEELKTLINDSKNINNRLSNLVEVSDNANSK